MRINAIKEELRDYILDNLDLAIGNYGSELDYPFFNQDHYIIYHNVAKEWCDKYDVDGFEIVEYNIQQEIDNFGECYWVKELNGISKLNWEGQVNLLVYWLGRDVLYDIDKTLDEMWDREVTEEDLPAIREALEELEY